MGNEVLVLVKSSGINPDDCITKHAEQIFDKLLPIYECESIYIIVIIARFVLAANRQILL